MVAPRPTPNPAVISLALKAVGSVLLAASFIDYLVLLVPPDFTSAEWRFQFTTQLIDRGVIPLIGISLIMLGLWMGGIGERNSSRGIIKPITLGFAGVLGFLMLFMAPLHIIDAGKASAAATRQLNNQTTQVQQQLEFRLQQERAQIAGVLENPEQLKQLDTALSSSEITPEEKTRLEEIKANLARFKDDPSALEAQQEQARTLALEEINERNQTERARISGQFNKSRFRIGFSGLLISAAYLLIFWTGFQGTRR